MDGVLRKLTDRTWEGTLRGCRVQVFRCGGGWHFCVINQRGHVEICPPGASLADGARRARAWLDENHPGPEAPSDGLDTCDVRGKACF